MKHPNDSFDAQLPTDTTPESTQWHLEGSPRPSEDLARALACLADSVSLLARSVELFTGDKPPFAPNRDKRVNVDMQHGAPGLPYESQELLRTSGKCSEKQTDYGTMSFAGVKRGAITEAERSEAVAIFNRGWSGAESFETMVMNVVENFARSRGVL